MTSACCNFFGGEWAGIQDLLPVQSLECEGGSVCVEWLHMTWKSLFVCGIGRGNLHSSIEFLSVMTEKANPSWCIACGTEAKVGGLLGWTSEDYSPG